MQQNAADVSTLPTVEDLYNPLRRIAQALLRKERRDLSWEATDLVHQTLVNKLMNKPLPQCEEAHLLGVAVRAMKQVIIDRARRRATREKSNAIAQTPGGASAPELGIMIRKELKKLARTDPRGARVIQQRVLERRTWDEIASGEQISVRTARDDYEFAMAWLRDCFGVETV